MRIIGITFSMSLFLGAIGIVPPAFAVTPDAVQTVVENLNASAKPNISVVTEARLKISPAFIGKDFLKRFEVEVEENKVVLRYSYAAEILQNQTEYARDMILLKYFSERLRSISDRAEIIEGLLNVQRGSPGAEALVLTEFNKKSIQPALQFNYWHLSVKNYLNTLALAAQAPTLPTETQADEIAKNLIADFKAEIEMKTTRYRQQFAAEKKSWENWKKQTGLLEALDKSGAKLDDLIRKNDRHGARQLIENYLPWTMMEPFEMAAWKTWLDAIETRPTTEDSIVLFRGVNYDTDLTFRAADGKPGFMSTLLTKNQGSYNRRLRSFANRRLENSLKDDDTEAQKKSPVVTIARQFHNHAIQAQASSFMSYSPVYVVAEEFAGKFRGKVHGGMVAIRVPKSRVIYNDMGLPNEKEFLLPLVLFPEDVVVFKEYDNEKAFTADEFMSELKKHLTPAEYENMQRSNRPHDDDNKIEMATSFLKSMWAISKQLSASVGQCRKVFGL